MAKTGLRYIVVAKLIRADAGAAPTYEKGMVLGAGVAADITYTINEARAYALNVKKVEDRAAPTWRTIGKSAPYVGIGFIEERIIDGVTKHLPTWVYKCQFAPQGKSAQTRGENVEFRTTQVNGEMMGVYPDTSGDVTFIDEKEFENGEDATAWINEMAGITTANAAAMEE